jgi:co-chaperonin GroES (HSP10)
MIKPINKHLLIEPTVQDSFMASNDAKSQEIGTVIAIDDSLWTLQGTSLEELSPVKVGDKVYFDSWLAAKFPKGNDEFYWLIQWDDVRAIDPC